MESFQKLLQRIAERFDSRDAFAKAIGINGSRLSRALNAGDFPFNVENCLRLAKISGESPSAILRAAGKGDVADLIEMLYGSECEYTVDEQLLLDAWRALPDDERDALRRIILARRAPAAVEAKRPRKKTA